MSDTWNGTGSWTTDDAAWSGLAPPTPGQTAEIATGAATLAATATIAALQVDAPASAELVTGGSLTVTGSATTAGSLYLQNGGSLSVSGALSLTGDSRVQLDGANIGGSGGSRMTVGGTLTNSSTDGNAVSIGNTGLTSGDTVTVGGLVNTGVVTLESSTGVQSLLNIGGAAGFGTTGVVTGTMFLQNDALLEFASGQLGTVAATGELYLDGAGARVADSTTLTSSSALTGLSTVAGSFYLSNGASVTVNNGVSLTGVSRLQLDGANIGGSGGTSLSINGTLTNSSTDGNAISIGNGGITSGDTVTATGLVNTGVVTLESSTGVQSLLNITGAAGFGTTGVVTGTMFLQNDALLEFASGQLGTVAATGELYLEGAGARVADSTTLTSSSALTGLSSIAGSFYLSDGASVSVNNSISLTGDSLLQLDGANIGGSGGTSLSVNGTLTNASTDGNAISIGNGGITSGDTVTATGLVNTGAVALESSTGVQSLLNITGAAGFGTLGVVTGTMFLQNDALLEFASGQLGTVAATGELYLDGAGARVADSTNLTSSSALTGLSTVAGSFYLSNGASVSVNNGVSLTGDSRLQLDGANIGGLGGASLSINGTLTNSSTDGNAISIGNGGITSGDTVTASGLVNTGIIELASGTGVQSLLNIGGAAGFGTTGVVTGTMFLQNDALLEFASGELGTVAATGELYLDGAGARVADSTTLTSSSALTGLSTVAGSFYLSNGASVSVGNGVSVTGGGRLQLDGANIGGIGGTSLSINGTLTNSSTDSNAVSIGNGGITSGDTVTTTGLANSGALAVAGGTSALTALDVNGAGTNNGTVFIESAGEIVVGNGNAYTQASNATNVLAGGTLVAPDTKVTGGTLDGTGEVLGTVDNNGGGTIFGGQFLGTPGTLTIAGTYDQTGTGVLEANINGSTSGVVAVAAGDLVNLTGGTLLLSAEPTLNTPVTVMTFTPGDLVGQFAQVQFGTSIGDGSNVALTDGSTLEVLYNNTKGTIQVERVTTSTLATGYTWTAAAGTGNWSTAADWSGGAVPNPAANVVIGAGTTGNVTLNGSDATVNSLSILASNTLTISSVTLTSATGGSGISVASGGTLSLTSGGEINGSVLGGAGQYQVQSSGILADDTIGSSTSFNAVNNTTLGLLGTITNQGSINLNSSGNQTNLVVDAGTVTLTGSGRVNLSSFVNNRILGNTAGAVLDNVNNTIAGAGEIGVNGDLTVENQALIDANAAAQLTIDTQNPLQNTGTIRSSNTTAGNGGLLVLNAVINNTGSSNAGKITAIGVNTHVDLQNGDLIGGTITTSGGGLVDVVTGTGGTLDGSTLPLTISAGSTVQDTNNASLTILGSIVTAGTISIAAVGNLTNLIAGSGTVTLTGAGNVALSDSATNRIYGGIAGTVLDNVNDTISGAGEIGVNGNLTLVNQSLINANATAALTLDGSSPTLNTGTLESTNTTVGNGGLRLSSTVIDNTGSSNAGQIKAIGTNSNVGLTNATIKGGTITTTGGGLVDILSAGTLDGTTAPVTITAGSTVQVNNNAALTLLGSVIAQGVIDLNSSGNLTDLIIGGGGTVSLTGPGGIVTTSTVDNRIYGSSANAVLDNVNSDISGAGEIGVNGNLFLVNQSLVDANQAAALTIDSSNVVKNTGTLRASNTTTGNGGLVLSGTKIDNTGSSNAGLILATGANSHVNIVSATTILGGTLTATNGGVFNVSNGTLDGSGAGAPIDITSGTAINVANNALITLNGTINNAGTLALNSTGNLTDMIVGPAGVLLQGGGQIAFTDNTQNRIYTNTADAVLENVNNTISGAGQLIPNSGLILKNDTAGVIDATGANALSISGFSGTLAVQNTGLLESTAGAGGLLINSSSVIDNTGNSNAGKLTANGAGTHIDITSGADILGGTLTALNGGTFNLSNGELDGSKAGAPVNVAGSTTVNIANDTIDTLNGTINNQGTFALNSTGNLTDVVVGPAGLLLTGGGSITLSNNTGNRIYTSTANAVLENVNNTISGAGQIFTNSGMVLKNDTAGVIDAVGTAALTITNFTGSFAVQNVGLLESASGSGGLIFANSVINNTGSSNAGQIVANGAGTHVDITANTTIQGGTLTSKNGGVLNGTASTLDGTAAGAPVNITAGTTLIYGNNTTNNLLGTINNAGVIEQNSTGNLTDLLIGTAGATLTGGGSLVLSDFSSNRIYANGAAVLTNANNTISGAGTMFTNGGLSLVNSATVNATDSVALALGLNITNNASGTLVGSGSGGLSISSGTITNNGLEEALDSSSVINGSAAVDTNNTGGTLTGGTWEAVANGHNAVIDVTGGTITTDAADIILSGTGSSMLAYNGSTYVDIQSSLSSIAATGQLHILANQNFTDPNAIGNAGLVDLGGGTFTTKTFTNSGTLSGFGKVSSSTGAALSNSGQVTATGGNLILAQGITGTTGNVTINSGASLDVSGATVGNTVGTLLHDGANLALGSQTVTVSADYNNAAFGVGNAFNSHANVTGTGAIVAAGNTGLGVTGSLISGGTLALGIVHVNDRISSTITVTNTGNTGPVLRGAIQNTGLSNGELGLTAENYGPLASGASTTDTLTFDPTTAGALSGQSFKVVTNFDNVAAQTIAVSSTVNNYASLAVANATTGTLSGSGTSYTLNLGNISQGGGTITDLLDLLNSAVGPADALAVLANSFSIQSGSGFTISEGAFSGLAAGATQAGDLTIGLSTANTGQVTETITLTGTGTNGSGWDSGMNVLDPTLTIEANVINTAPQLAGSLVTISPVEGTPLPATTTLANFTDTNLSDVSGDLTASINWGDGTITSGTVTGSNGSFSVDGGHTYADEGSDPLSITVADTLNNATLPLSGSVTVAEGDTLTAHAVTFAATTGTAFSGTVATFSDVDTASPASDFTATINWGDGVTNAGTVSGSGGTFTVSGSHTYSAANTDTVTVTLTDDAPGTATATASSTADVTNAAPQLAGSLVTISPVEGTPLPATTTLANFTDTNLSDVSGDLTASINWGDGTITSGTVTGSNGSFSVDGGHTYADEGSDPLSITVADTLNNATLPLSGSVTVAEGDTLTAHAVTFAATTGTAFSGTVATFSDVDTASPASDFTATINWGDGSVTNAGTVSGSGGTFTVSGSHTYSAANTDTVTVTLTDDAPGTATATASSTADVTNAAPQLAGSLVTISPVEGTPLPATTTLANFTDTNLSDVSGDLTASINWGDGTITSGTVTGSNGSFSVDGGHTYADEGSDPLSITVADTLNNATLPLSGSVTVAEGDTLTAHAVTFAATTGTAFSGTVATFSDVDTASPASDFTATINWGDGVTNSGTVSGSGGTFTVSGSHTYSAANTDTVTVTLTDDAPGTATATASSTADVTNAAPQLAGSLVTISPVEGTPLPATTTLANFTDTNLSDVSGDLTASINWGDGTITSGTVTGSNGSFSVDGGHTYADEGSDPLSITVADTLNNATLPLSGSVTVAEGDTLTAHAVTFAATTGTAFSGTVATFSDVDTASPASDFTATINWGDGVTNSGTVSGSGGTFTVSGSHTYSAANTDTVTVTLTDDAPGTATATASSTADVTNAAPQLAGSLVTISPVEGTPLPATTTLANFTDTNLSDVSGDLTASINWGDGTITSGTVTGSNGSFSVDGGHTYADEGSDPLSITVADTLNNATLPLSGSVTVAEGDTLTAHAVTFAATTGTAFSGTVATFSDVDTASPASDFTATINWGDGVTNAGTVSGSGGTFTVSGSHTYSAANTDTVTVTLTDDAPGTATATASSTADVTAPTSNPPTISGAVANQLTTDEKTIKALRGVSISDPNAGATESVTLTLTNGVGGSPTDANGALSGSGLTKSGTGTYTLTAGSAAAVTAELEALVFTPTAHEAPPGQTVTTGIAISDNDGLFTATNTITSVIATAMNDAPVIAGTHAGQTTKDYFPVNPFNTATITDADVGVTDSLTIKLTNSSNKVTDANGTLSGAGLSKTGVGTYTLAAATPAALTSELEALTFTPTQHEIGAGKTVTTNFTLTASQTAGGSTVTTTNSTTSVVATALNYINGPKGGFGFLVGTPGQDVITAFGSYNVIFGNGGPDIINAGNGEAYVNVDGGSAMVTLGGGNNVVVGNGGKVTVTGGPGGNNEVFLGDGNNVLQIGGRNDYILLGNGNNVISGGQGMEFIASGSGNDTITLGGSGNQVNAGGGNNVIHGGTGNDTFVLPGAGRGFDTITGFTELNGDVLDLRAALAATSWNGKSTTLGNYLKVTDNAGSTTLSIATKGTGAGTAIATLSGSGNLGLADLLSHHSLLT